MPDNGPRNVFVYLLNFLTLYLSALGAAMLTWGLADHWFPDPLDGSVGNGPIRTGIAMLVVAFPLFLYLNVYVRNELETGELSDRSLIKRILTYLTLFIIAITTIIDLIAVIYYFLGGDLTARFAVRGIGILMIAGFVFLYYLGDLREPKVAAPAVAPPPRSVPAAEQVPPAAAESAPPAATEPAPAAADPDGTEA